MVNHMVNVADRVTVMRPILYWAFLKRGGIEFMYLLLH